VRIFERDRVRVVCKHGRRVLSATADAPHGSSANDETAPHQLTPSSSLEADGSVSREIVVVIPLLMRWTAYTQAVKTTSQLELRNVFVFATKTDTRRMGTGGSRADYIARSRDRPSYTNLLHYPLGLPSVYAALHAAEIFLSYIYQSSY
jgi:hypothetical protein